MIYDQVNQIKQIIEQANNILIIQADNPDADSLGSALGLEHILGDLGKNTYMYCSSEMPSYLRYLVGWDRVMQDLPSSFDASIIVDASTLTLLERIISSGKQGVIASKPCIVLDHHATVENPINFATVTVNDPSCSSAGELTYKIAKQAEWHPSAAAQECFMSAILGDTQGLSNQLASSETYRVMAEFIDSGVDRPHLEELRREYGKMPLSIYKYKGELIKRTQFGSQGRIATVVIPQAEINKYSPLYNPGPLIQGDMLQTTGVKIAIVIKSYDDGRVTGAIRCNNDAPVGGKLAEFLGGGGHDMASGFKITDGRNADQIRVECIQKAEELLNESIQHTN